MTVDTDRFDGRGVLRFEASDEVTEVWTAKAPVGGPWASTVSSNTIYMRSHTSGDVQCPTHGLPHLLLGVNFKDETHGAVLAVPMWRKASAYHCSHQNAHSSGFSDCILSLRRQRVWHRRRCSASILGLGVLLLNNSMLGETLRP